MKNKNKTPLPLRIIAWLFPKVELVAPWLAKRWFVDIFLSTARYPYPKAEKEIMERAKKTIIYCGQKKVQVYEWGSGEPVLLMHGWMGRATQFREFVPALMKQGYRIIAFDATGHGLSDGKKSNLLEFASSVLDLQEIHGSFKMVVGHSLGGVALLHAIKQGLRVNKLVMISSPTIGDDIVKEFRKKIGASEKSLPYFDSYFRKKLGASFNSFEAKSVIKEISGFELLLIYDHHDKEVSMDHARALLKNYPSAILIETKNLGHTRILRDKEVVNSAVDFAGLEKVMP